MGRVESIAFDHASEIERHDCRVTTKLSRETKFSKCAKVAWRKPAPDIAAIVGCDVRTAQRMLAGTAEIPWCVLRELINEITKPG